MFVDYTGALNAPVNDDLYSLAVIASGTTRRRRQEQCPSRKPPTPTKRGYRYQTSSVNATVDGYYLEDDNHIVQAYNQLTQDWSTPTSARSTIRVSKASPRGCRWIT